MNTNVDTNSFVLAPDGPPERTAAFFDMDKTVLSCNSAGRYARYLFRRGELRLLDALRTARWLIQYRLALIDAAAVSRRAISSIEGEPEADMIELCRVWFEEDVRQFIAEPAVQAIEAHRARGHRVVLLTAATPYIAEPVSEHLALDDYISTQLEVDDDGYFTGRAIEPLCYGEGKIHWASGWADTHGIDFEHSYFYTDSYTDRPMLDRIGNAVAVNPDPRLRRYARREKIPILRWDR